MSKQSGSGSFLGSSPWEKLGLEDQLLYGQDGFVFNLSSIDWDSAKVYEYESSNSSETKHDVVTTGRSVALSIFALIFFVGLVGNALVIYTMARYATMRRGTYLYLLNLSVADILYLLICLPTLSVSYALVDWKFGRVFCKLENYMMSVTMSVSVLTILATGLDRYIAVIHPLRSRSFRTDTKTVTVILFTWILSLAVMAPRILIFDEISVWHIVGMTTLCSRVQTDHILQIDTSLSFVFMYLLPLLVLSACHFRIGRKLWKSRRPGIRAKHSGQMGILLVRDRRRIAKMVFAITIVFVVGWLPIHVYHLAEDFDKGNILFGELIDRGTIALFFSFGANALNPIFYCLFSSSFRRHFEKAFQCWRPRFIASVNTDNFGTLKVPTGKAGVQHEYRRPPPVLLPRPASLLVESISSIENTTIYLRKSTPSSCSALPSISNLLTQESELNDSFSALHSNCSPGSVKEVTTNVRVSNYDWNASENNQKEHIDTPYVSLKSNDFFQPQNIIRMSRHSGRNRWSSISCTSLARSSAPKVICPRPKSAEWFSNERRNGVMLTSIQGKLDCRVPMQGTLDCHDPISDKYQTSNACNEIINHVTKQTKLGSTAQWHHFGSQSLCSHTFPISMNPTNNTSSSKTNHLSYKIIDNQNNKENAPHVTNIRDNLQKVARSDTKYSLQETSTVSVSTSKLRHCDLVSCIPSSSSKCVNSPVVRNHNHRVTIHDTSSHANVGINVIKKKTNKTTQKNNFPPVD